MQGPAKAAEFQCPLCSTCVKTKRSFERHLLGQHKDKPDDIKKHVPHPCFSCCKSFKSADALTGHSCASSARTIGKRSAAPEHIQQRKRQRLDPVGDCCKKPFYSEQTYWRHMANHGLGMLCAFSFPVLICSLPGHLFEKYPCSFCPQKFFRSDRRDEHMLIKHQHGVEEKLHATIISCSDHAETWWMHTGVTGWFHQSPCSYSWCRGIHICRAVDF